MTRQIPRLTLAFALLGGLALGGKSPGQTPEQEKMWEEQRVQARAAEKAQGEELARQRAARKADPMAWVRTLDPMSAGGWEFETVASDGAWATFTTRHQLKRSGQVVTAWIRQEYAEPQASDSAHYLSVVEKAQYDCGKERERAVLRVYYSANNIQGGEQSDEADPKNPVWTAIVPGTRDEISYIWACNAGKTASR